MKMTLDQKCALLSGKSVFQTREYKNLGIPSIWLSDGPHDCVNRQVLLII